MIADIVNSSNFIIVATLAVVAVIVAVILMKKGWLSLNVKGVHLGIQETERTILRDQWDLINTVLDGYGSELLQDHPELSEDRTKRILSKVGDVFQQACVLNSMNLSDAYIHLKQITVYNTVIKRANNEYFRSNEFKQFCNEFTKDLIENLIKIREARS